MKKMSSSSSSLHMDISISNDYSSSEDSTPSPRSFRVDETRITLNERFSRYNLVAALDAIDQTSSSSSSESDENETVSPVTQIILKPEPKPLLDGDDGEIDAIPSAVEEVEVKSSPESQSALDLVEMHNRKAVNCDYCDKKFMSESFLNKHVNKFHSEKGGAGQRKRDFEGNFIVSQVKLEQGLPSTTSPYKDDEVDY